MEINVSPRLAHLQMQAYGELSNNGSRYSSFPNILFRIFKMRAMKKYANRQIFHK